MDPFDATSANAVRDRLVFVAILALAAVARLVGLLHHATMPDEAFTFFIAARPVPAIVALLKTGDFHPPLVYLIGHGLLAFTTRAYLLRIVSALFGIAGVAATYAVSRRALGAWGAVVALLVALNPALVFFDGFFRMYAMLWSLCMMSWALLLWALELDRPLRWLAYASCVIALLYTQYLAFFTLAAQMGYVLVFDRRRVAYWIATAAALAAFAPWLPILIAQYPLGGTAYNVMHSHWSQMWQAAPVMLIDGLPLSLELSPFVCATLWCSLLAGLVLVIVQRRWLIAALLAPLALQIGYSLLAGKLLLGQRYLLQAIPVLVMLVVVVAQTLWHTRARPVALALVASLTLMMAAGTIDKHFLAPYMPIDWTEYRRFLDAHVQPGDAVVFDSSMVYYVLIGSKAASDRPLFLVTDPHDAANGAARAAKLARIWLVDYQSELPDPQHLAFTTLARTHPQFVTWRSTQSGYGDVVLTTLFLPAGARRSP
jgi:hypothetical protein